MEPLAEHFLREGDVGVLLQSELSYGPGYSWYPHSFMAPVEANQPALDRALDQITQVLALAHAHGVPSDQVMLVGFSQGACLATEFVARNPRRYGGLVAFTGALIRGSAQGIPPQGSLDGTKVILVSSDPDPHVPASRVDETAKYFTQLSADVKVKLLSGAPHQITPAALAFAEKQLASRVCDKSERNEEY